MKIAILGSDPASMDLAPYGDPSWEIWACSPGTLDAPRVDVRFELHNIKRLESDVEFRGYIECLKAFDVPIYMQRRHPEFKLSIAYPIQQMIGAFGKYFLTSSVAHMLALAISFRPTAIGIWGVSMTDDEEYGWQRAGCHFFIEWAKRAGIEIVMPDGCPLIRHTPIYGFESDPE